jgi:hypothetical protein
MLKQDQKWWLVSTGAALLASSLAKSAMERGYKGYTGRRAPQNPASPRVTWRSAFAWAMAAGIIMSVSELLAERGAAAGWRRATGKYPRSLMRKKT